MSAVIDKEIEAIGTVLKALEPLDSKARQSVLNYVLRRLDIEERSLPPGERVSRITEEPMQVHIKDLVKEKAPGSAQEMATLVAYYLAYKAPKKDQKQTVTTKDVETYFKIAEFKLPTKPQFLLVNTKKAGYLDAVGEGEYKLNPVGYNLVVHSLPKSREKTSRRRPPRKKSAPKKADKAKR